MKGSLGDFRQPVTPKCPGCGSDLYAQQWGVDRKGVSRLTECSPGFVTFRETSDARLTCERGCVVTVQRESPEMTSKQLDAYGRISLIEELCKR